jgi:peptidoglycan hydrolase-like protein with peptidoglycan-binding domain
VTVVGTVRPFVGHQKVQVRLGNGGDNVLKANPYLHQVKGKNFGRIKLRSQPLLHPGKYRARASKKKTAQQAGGIAKSDKFSLKYIDLDPGDRGPAVALFNDLLRDAGYYDTDGHKYGSHTERAVLAFRKVNGMERIVNANPTIFKLLAAGQGGFQPKYPGAGKHVEVDISKQVMALVNKGKAQYVFHVSTGAPATPSDQGEFTFYRKDPGYNSEGMYYSVYYNRGEATHGYASVPTYNASHGCIRNPIPDSVFIYNWIDLGDHMYVYG